MPGIFELYTPTKTHPHVNNLKAILQQTLIASEP